MQYHPIYLNYSEAVDTLKNRQAAGVYANSFSSGSAISDLLFTGDFHIMSFNRRRTDAIVSDDKFYYPYTIEAGVYPNQDKAVETYFTYNIFQLSDEIDVDYRIRDHEGDLAKIG